MSARKSGCSRQGGPVTTLGFVASQMLKLRRLTVCSLAQWTGRGWMGLRDACSDMRVFPVNDRCTSDCGAAAELDRGQSRASVAGEYQRRKGNREARPRPHAGIESHVDPCIGR